MCVNYLPFQHEFSSPVSVLKPLGQQIEQDSPPPLRFRFACTNLAQALARLNNSARTRCSRTLIRSLCPCTTTTTWTFICLLRSFYRGRQLFRWLHHTVRTDSRSRTFRCRWKWNLNFRFQTTDRRPWPWTHSDSGRRSEICRHFWRELGLRE